MATVRSRHVKEPFEIHHDEMDESMEQSGAGEESRVEEGEEMEVDGYSEASDETDEAVDVSLQQDMEKFEETFQDMRERFRLINRIGEGKLVLPILLLIPILTFHRYLFDCVQG
jgi:cell division control protein 7